MAAMQTRGRFSLHAQGFALTSSYFSRCLPSLNLSFLLKLGALHGECVFSLFCLGGVGG